MTSEQHKAMTAVLAAVAEAVKVGLTEKEIIEKIVRNKPSEPPESKSVESFDS
jgi:hypothetical protein